jgi:hypothetical protein
VKNIIKRWNKKTKTKFYVANNAIGVETALQFFIVLPYDRYKINKFKTVRIDVLKKRVTSMPELIDKHQHNVQYINSSMKNWRAKKWL